MTAHLLPMPIMDSRGVATEMAEKGERLRVLWQAGESLAFIARGRDYRSEFHINPSDEVMVMLIGEMRLHYRPGSGAEEVAVLPEGSTIFTQGGIPHSPRFDSNSFVMVLERLRRPDELDRFQWFCPQCDRLLHTEEAHVADYRSNPVTLAYQHLASDEAARTCAACGTVLAIDESILR